MVYWLYNTAFTVLFFVALPLLPVLLLLGERFRAGFRQRLGFYPRSLLAKVRDSNPIWIHAVSVGEVLSAGPLTEKLKERFPSRLIIVSTFTLTGNLIARKATCADAVIFLPLDHPWIVQRALRTLEPALIIFLETEIWPNLLRSAHRRGIPALLLSGRLSSRALKKYSLFGVFFRRVVRQFTAIGMQSEEDAQRMARLGVDREKISITGSLKHASASEESLGNARSVSRVQPSGQEEGFVLVGGSTHRGEEEILLDVFSVVREKFPRFRMVLAPRHPQRFPEVEKLLKSRGIRFEKKSQMNGKLNPRVDIILLDTIGDLLAFYAMADIAFVGGSLVQNGGHNLLEPARFRKPILFGPHMTNFKLLAVEMREQGGGIEVSDRADLIREISILLSDPEKARIMGEKAYRVAADDRGVVERSLGVISRYL